MKIERNGEFHVEPERGDEQPAAAFVFIADVLGLLFLGACLYFAWLIL